MLKPLWKEELADSLEGDEEVQDLLAKIVIGDSTVTDYFLHNGELKKKGKYYVGSNGQLREKIGTTIHGSMEGGHSGIAASIKRAELIFFWPGLRRDITKIVKECDICQRNKAEHVASPGLLQPIEIPEKAWEVISMDFIEGLPKSAGKDSILVVVDKLTKYCHLITLTYPFTAHKVAQEFLN